MTFARPETTFDIFTPSRAESRRTFSPPQPWSGTTCIGAQAGKCEAGPGRVLGEAVFAPQPGQEEEDHGWLLMQGYDARRDESFLEVRDAGELNFVARVWTGHHFPLGFHGNFYPISSAGR